MLPFSYAAADTERTAFDLALGIRGALFVAGGTDITQLLRDEVIAPPTLIDINSLPLAGIEVDDQGARIGALTRLSDVAHDARIEARYPMLTRALRETASPQVRNMATVGGNLLQRTRCLYFRDSSAPCNKRAPGTGCGAMDGQNRINAILGGSAHCIAAYPGDLAVALVALDARIVLHGPRGERTLAAEDLHRLPGDTPDRDTVLRPGEIITAVTLPATGFSASSCFLKVRDRATFEWALVSVAVGLEVKNGTVRRARIAAGGVGTRPWRLPDVEAALTGQTLSPDSVAEAAALAADGAEPRAGNAFKVTMLERVVERAVLTAGALS